MQSDPDDFDADDDFDGPLTPSLQPPLAPQQKLPSLRGVDDEFNEEDFDDDFDDDFEEELEDDYPFEVALGDVAPIAPVGDEEIDVETVALDDDEAVVEPADDAEAEETDT